MQFGLKDDIVEKIGQICSQFLQVKEVIIYGSRAKGSFKPGSDVDLTFKGENLDLKIINKIRLEIDDLLLPYTFDLSVFSQIENPELVEHIKRVGKVFYKNKLASISK